ncbi:MAG TPA: sulfatase-like hydrolase/transferase [Edaphobacter sp.]|nr:sulfatase-like hydrolase/transferase [Edaphobacter sp.]
MKIKRRNLIKSFGAVTATAILGTRSASAENPGTHSSATKRPNILVFLTDDHGQWLQQAYGNSEVQTPNMTRIAQNGVRMTNAFTTCPVCSPARASFFTGRMPSQHGIHDWIEETKQAYAYPWLKGQTLISELFKAAGYHTGLVGKWHCGEERYPHPGFDRWFSYWVNQYPHFGKQNFSDQGKHVTAEGLQSPFLTEQAIRFLRGHHVDKSSRPFFLFVGYTDTHSPHSQMPQELLSKYENSTFRDIPKEPFAKVHGETLIPVSKDASVERTKHEQYYAAASSIDREVGKILDELESIGEMENTLVVYTGDHGLNAGQHGTWEKGNATIPQNFLEESIRIPCAISWPGGSIPRNLDAEIPVNHCDLFMTLLDAAKALPDDETAKKINSPGQSYLAQLQGKSLANWRDYTICEYGNARMIRSDGYKLILRYPFQGVNFPNELYDLKADPRETVNLYDNPDPRYRKIIQQMSAHLNEFFSKYTVPEHDGLHLEQQPMATPASPWLEALKMPR